MSEQHTTPLARVYQEMVDAGLIVLVAEAGRFICPSMRVRVPSATTYGVCDTRGLGEELCAQLERTAILTNSHGATTGEDAKEGDRVNALLAAADGKRITYQALIE